jgi:endonuclease/exonuclease/phosphatase family metal-dependent hydrolase
VGRVAEVIAAERPDIVALQELDVRRARSGKVDQAHAIAERLGMAFHFNAAVHVAEEQYGDAILSTLPIQLVKSGPLPRVRGLERRGALWVEVQIAGARPLQIVNTHLGLVPAEQRAQAQHLLGEDWLGHPNCRDPLILLGDFNATPRYAAYKMIAARLTDARRAAGVRRGALTFPSRLPMLRIDHMFIGAGVAVRRLFASSGPTAKLASDHLPLVADVEIEAVAAPS